MPIYNTVIKSGGGTQIIQIPSAATTTFSYDGTEQNLSLTNYNPAIMTARNISATVAGEYTASFSLKDISSSMWSDNTTTDKTISWVINKAQSSLALSKQSVTLNKDNLSDTVSITYVGDGTLTASSSDTDIVDVSLNNNVITISSVDNTTGSAIVTVSAIGTNYADISVDIDVSAQFITIYGAEWDGTSTTAWTRTDAAAGFTDPVPAVSNGNGSSPFDNCMPWSGMERVTDSEAGTLVKIPKFYYKWTRSGATMKLQIADGPVDGFLVSPAHADRGDGSGERDLVYVGAYHCSTNDYKSTTGVKPKANITRSVARSGIHNLGSKVWQWDYAMLWTIQMLYLVEYANWNSQAKIGYGCGNNSSVGNMGYTDSMPYHTGTTQASRTTYGLGTQYRNIEGLWDNVRDWMDGCYYNSNGLYLILNPASFSDSSGGTLAGLPSNGYPSKFTVTSNGGFPMFYASEANNGSESTYSCDSWYFNASDPCLSAGGSYYQSANCGMFCVDCSGASSAGGGIGSRLQKLP